MTDTATLNPSTITNKLIDQVLSFDPVEAAEQMAGASWKEDIGVSLAALGLSVKRGDDVRALMTATQDTHFGSTASELVAILEAEGFIEVYRCDIESREHETVGDYFCIYWHPQDNVLLTFDTYWGTNSEVPQGINSVKAYCNWEANEGVQAWEILRQVTTDGGSYGGDSQVHFGGRVALRRSLRLLRTHGTFLHPWKYRSGLWLCHWGDTPHDPKTPWAEKSAKYDRIRDERLEALPTAVRIGLGLE